MVQLFSDSDLPPPLRRTQQQRASDPAASVWVEASAGTGKTRILTDRVLRLLLEGAAPARILCLTFTNAAAAEMANRINERLGNWTIADDAELARDVQGLTAIEPDAATLRRARAMFASVLDAPGGLRVQTLHAFCQSLLARFPIEAGVSPHFSVMDERSAAALFAAAQEAAFAALGRESERDAVAALAAVSERVRENVFAEIMAELSLERGRLQHAFDRAGGLAELVAAIRASLDLEEAADRETLLREACDDNRLDAAGLRAAAAALRAGGAIDKRHGAVIAGWLADPAGRPAGFDAYLGAFFKDKGRGEPRAKLIHRKARQAAPHAERILAAEAARLAAIRERMRRARLLEASAALLRLGDALLREYEAAKRRSGRLDYDDLILKTRSLLRRPGAASWVLFKLDGGIDHILIDEAQDTNPDQWAIVAALAEEFFAGEGARERTRTIFAVGDPKQSIYSFQRADPEAFARWRRVFEGRARAGGEAWHSVPLARSYRSAPVILDCVDRVFARAAAAGGLLFENTAIAHAASRSGQAGVVELWPVEAPIDDTDDGWSPPVERVDHRSPRLELARKIARQVARWRDDGERLPSRERPIAPGDILVLVQRRSGFVAELVRALKERDLPVAGTDRMVLSDQLAVRDLIALGRFALLPSDDLTLAELLKSPLIGFGEELLFELAHGRTGRLWPTLVERSRDDPRYADARARLAAWLARADRVPPYEFFAEALIAEGGRRKLVERLGPQANDPIDEFLSQALHYQLAHAPSLEGFLHWLESSEAEVRRDLEFGRDEIRVLTVHGAKGLEAPIVFLPDTCRVPRQDSRILWLANETAGELPLWPPRRELEVGAAEAARRAARTARDDEYRRLLYVAMTRAEDRLYVGGWTTKKLTTGCWYDLIRSGLADVAVPVETAIAGPVLRVAGDQSAAPDRREAAPPAADGATRLPDWALRAPPPEPAPPRPLAPSRPSGSDPPARSPLARTGDRRRRGRLIHRLLEFLPDLAEAERRDAAMRLLADAAPDLDGGVRAEIAAATLAALSAPGAAAAFAPGSRAEVPIIGRVGDIVVSGQVDRLAVGDDAVVVVDYKSHRNPPAEPDRVPPLYRRQMAAYRAVLGKIYPGKSIACYLLWTEGPNLVRLSDGLLAETGLTGPA